MAGIWKDGWAHVDKNERDGQESVTMARAE